jgi:hypothetical protein
VIEPEVRAESSSSCSDVFIYLLAARGSFIRKFAFLNRTYQYFIFYVVIIDSAFINKEGLFA